MVRKSVLTYRGAYEGLQEELYFLHLEDLINHSPFPYRVAFHLKNGNGGSAKDIVLKANKYALNVSDDMKVAVFDHDFKEDSFLEALKLAEKYHIFPAFSIMNFNLFLILHKKDYYKVISKEDNYEKDLRETYNIPKVYKIKSEKAIQLIVDQITLEDVKKAIVRAKKVNEESKKVQPVLIDEVYQQPFLNIHIFLEQVFCLLEEDVVKTK